MSEEDALQPQFENDEEECEEEEIDETHFLLGLKKRSPVEIQLAYMTPSSVFSRQWKCKVKNNHWN